MSWAARLSLLWDFVPHHWNDPMHFHFQHHQHHHAPQPSYFSSHVGNSFSFYNSTQEFPTERQGCSPRPAKSKPCPFQLSRGSNVIWERFDLVNKLPPRARHVYYCGDYNGHNPSVPSSSVQSFSPPPKGRKRENVGIFPKGGAPPPSPLFGNDMFFF